MWSVGAWEEIPNFLPDNGNESRVVVTTRLSNLAAHLSSSPFKMNFLDHDNSWELFCGKAFGEEEDCPVELEGIGKKIVRRCGELPLSVVVIGGHLRRSRVIRYWEEVATFMNPISSLEEEEQCMEILSLSYQHLPPYLNPCFLYFGIFQEDQWIDASRLVKFLVCEGFIKPKEGLSLEEVAGDYVEELIDRNLIFVRQRRWNRKVQYFGVHDIVRELCLKLCKKEKFMYVLEDTTEGIGSERRIVIRRGKLSYFMIADLKSAPLIRTLICQGVWLSDELSIDFRLVRLSIGAKFLPDTHFKQVNLTYLSFEKPSTMSRFSKKLSLHYRLYGDDVANSYYCLQNIGRFNKLESLICVFSDDSKQRDTVTRSTFPSSLVELSLWNSRLRWEDLTVMICLAVDRVGLPVMTADYPENF